MVTSNSPGEISQLLAAWGAGEEKALDELMPRVYQDLRVLAARQMRRERAHHTLQTTGLVNEAFLRLVQQEGVQWSNRSHFFAIAATAMRRILTDRVRSRMAAKRGGDWQRVTLSGMTTPTGVTDVDLLALEEALTELRERSERQCRVVELRFFGGLSVEETARVLGLSTRSVENDWRVARAWLATAIEGEGRHS